MGIDVAVIVPEAEGNTLVRLEAAAPERVENHEADEGEAVGVVEE